MEGCFTFIGGGGCFSDGVALFLSGGGCPMGGIIFDVGGGGGGGVQKKSPPCPPTMGNPEPWYPISYKKHLFCFYQQNKPVISKANCRWASCHWKVS